MLAALVALALTAVSQAEIWFLWAPDADEPELALTLGEQAVVGIASAALTLSLAVHRRLPWLPLALAVPAIALAPSGPFDAFLGLALAVGVAAFLAASSARTRTELWLAATLAIGVVVATRIAHPDSVAEPGDLVVLVAGVGGPALAGAAIWFRRAREGQLDLHARRLDESRAAELLAAATAERARIARELHDVVAHAISVIVLQARGARRSLDADPAQARSALDAIEDTASAAMGEMRRLVDVLRPADEQGALSPQPGLAALDALIADAAEAGLPVSLVFTGEPVELPRGVDLAAYRVIQEALTNTRRHAGAASASVTVRYGEQHLEIEVTDDGSGSPAGIDPWRNGRIGRGLVGMRERAALYGGSLDAGPGPDRGFRVLARIPIGPESAG